MSRNFNLSQAASNGITVLPDVTKGLPSVGDVLTVQSTTSGVVATKFAPPGSGGTGAGYLPLSGGTLTGPLVLAGDPTTSAQAANRNYVDAVKTNTAANYLNLAGGTMVGPLTLAGPPSNPNDAATKTYVDTADGTVSAVANAAVKRAGDTMTGLLILSGDPSAGKGAATKTYVDTAVSTAGIPEAPLGVVTYGRNNGAWTGVLPLAGGTLTGPLLLNAAPTATLEAATKGYVDTSLSTGAVASFNTRTGTVTLTSLDVTNALTFTPYNATNPSNYTTKTYVDGAIAALPAPPAARNTAKLQAQWVTGAIVANDTIWFAYDAPYNGTITGMTYFTGAGSFSVAVQINGTSVTGLGTITVTSAIATTTPATALNTFTAGQRITGVITAATGSPTDALLSLAVTWS